MTDTVKPEAVPLPCPFCGCADIIASNVGEEEDSWFVGCMETSCHVNPSVFAAAIDAAERFVSTTDIVERLRAETDDDPRIKWAIELMAEAAAEITRLRAEVAERDALVDRLKLEAQIHAGEARTANSTIYEIYQALSGGKGEPGNWHGAEPARAFVAQAAEARNKALAVEEVLAFIRVEPSTGRHGAASLAIVLGDDQASYKFPASNSWEEAYFNELGGKLARAAAAIRALVKP